MTLRSTLYKIRHLTLKRLSEIPNIDSLKELHYKELRDTGGPPSITSIYDLYKNLEKQKLILCLGLFHKQVLVGYSIGYFSIDYHLSSSTVSYYGALIYVSPEHRGFASLWLLKETEERAEIQGARVVKWNAIHNSDLELLLQKMDYYHSSTTYTKQLEVKNGRQ